MNLAIMLIGLSLAAAPPANADEAMVEESIREHLSQQGEVLQVDMTSRDANSMAGFAISRDEDGVEGRVACTAQRNADDSFAWDCVPVITEPIVRRIEEIIGTNLAAQAEVLEIAMRRQDDMRMAGFARLRGADGAEIRANCTAVRENPRSRTFNWECQPDK